jgi:hypothetical protein
MAKPKYHVLVCTNTRPPGTPKGSCGERGAAEVAGRFFELVQTQGLFMDVIVSGTTCIGPCTMGPTVVVYPTQFGTAASPSDVDDRRVAHQERQAREAEVPRQRGVTSLPVTDFSEASDPCPAGLAEKGQRRSCPIPRR